MRILYWYTLLSYLLNDRHLILLNDCHLILFYFCVYVNIPIPSSQTGSQIKHDFNGITAASTGFKCFFDLFLWKSKPVGYKGLDIDLTRPQKVNAEWPCVPISENAYDIDLPAPKMKWLNLSEKRRRMYLWYDMIFKTEGEPFTLQQMK